MVDELERATSDAVPKLYGSCGNGEGVCEYDTMQAGAHDTLASDERARQAHVVVDQVLHAQGTQLQHVRSVDRVNYEAHLPRRHRCGGRCEQRAEGKELRGKQRRIPEDQWIDAVLQ
eukprot:scaffold15776_cov75-Phaeocystis_antarctica.AAC.3